MALLGAVSAFHGTLRVLSGARLGRTDTAPDRQKQNSAKQ